MFRNAITNKTPVGLKAKEFMDRGEYVPDGVVIDLIRHRLREPDCARGFILDGFPRTQPQATELDALLIQLGIELNAVFFFDVKKEVLVERLSGRRTCKNCNRIVNVEQLAQAAHDICEKKSGFPCDFYQRADDHADVVEKRIEVYQNQTAPILDFYRKKKNFVQIDASVSADQVYQIIEKTLKRT